jgi:four helix bundle protein
VFVFVFVFVFVRVRVRVFRERNQHTIPTDAHSMLDYERLDVYQCALRFAALSFRTLETMPRGHAEISDKLRRATMSIPLNIAEGAGKTTYNDRARYHATARGSAMECAAIFDLLRMQALVEPPTADEAKSLLERLVAMLTRMCW